MRCEDFPCCGHEAGCCPDFSESGEQLNMRCTCGAIVPIDNRVSICDTCLRAGDDDERDCDRDFEDEDDEFDMDESMDGDHVSGLASAGFGTDEDYGYYGGEDDWLDGSYEGE